MVFEFPGPLLLLSPSHCYFFSSLEVNRSCDGDGTPLLTFAGTAGAGRCGTAKMVGSIPSASEGERDARVFCVWKEWITGSCLWYTPCFPLSGPAFRSHPALPKCWQPAELGVSSPEDSRRRRLKLGAAASTGYWPW